MIVEKPFFAESGLISIRRLSIGLLLLASSGALPVAAATPPAKSSLTAIEREALTLYQASEFNRVIDLLQQIPPARILVARSSDMGS